MEEKIKAIINKVRELFKDQFFLKYVLKQNPIVTVREAENGDFVIEMIEFRWYDKLFIYKDKIVYSAPHRRNKILFKYSGFNDLLKIKQIDFDKNPIKIYYKEENNA